MTSTPWHVLSSEQVIALVASDARSGLSSHDASLRLAGDGPNALTEPPRRGVLRTFVAQFSDTTVFVLAGAAIVAGLLGEIQDTVAIVAILLLNGLLGFSQEYRAERAVAALKRLAEPTARLVRDGATLSVPSHAIVPGDILLLEAGNIIPADARLLQTWQLRVDESVLTGESQPPDKVNVGLPGEELPLGDRRNMVYRGTTVTGGRATAVVVATGMRTELGRVAGLLRDEPRGSTPLQSRLARLGRNLALTVVALCIVIFVAGLLRGQDAGLMFLTAVSLAVAAIPEALPAVVTVSLALGARRMARQRALIRRLAAVETLGSVTYICSDKTGTLTENRMHVAAIQTGAHTVSLPLEQPLDEVQTLLVQAMALNNDATRGANGELSGDPTECALYQAAAQVGAERVDLERSMPRVGEVAFSSDRSLMTTLHRSGDSVVAFIKGAPERVLARCVDRLGVRGHEPLDHTALLEDLEEMAESGLRVLALATRRLSAPPNPIEAAEQELTFLGFVGLIDPPRPEAKDAIAACRSAGIHVVMITGDHSATANAIATMLGIATDDTPSITGPELATLPDEELASRVLDIRVYARVAPEDKIRIVKALQLRGQYVAMTGDGINDAPALRRADIGVSMGVVGTDVAREASDMVLLNDNFATIANAVREGRRIYDNIRRFVRYVLSTNSGELWALVLAPFIGLPVPLLPIQILWMNLVTDGLPGVALAAEPAERTVMLRPPRPPTESVFAHGLWQHAIWVGLLMAAIALGLEAWMIGRGAAHWQSMTFTVLIFAQLGHVLAIRSERESLFSQGLLSNTPLLLAVTLMILLQLLVLYVPAIANIFKTTPLTARELVVCIAAASIPFFAVEGEKWLRRRRHDD